MDKEKFWQKWGPLCAAEAEATLKENLFADLDQYYVDCQVEELNKIKKALLKEQQKEFSEITSCTRVDKYGDCAASEKCPTCDNPPSRLLTDCGDSGDPHDYEKRAQYPSMYDCYD